ncbi:MAG: tetratricopeptide repeat-containing sensor histidine kinase [Aurantibacter sp.]
MKSWKTLLLIVIPSLLYPHLLNAQSGLDSLKIKLQNIPPGPEKFKMYGEISWWYISNSQFEEAFNYADSLRLGAEHLSDVKGVAQAQFYFGVIERLKGENSKALEHLNAFTDYFALIGDSAKVSHGLFQIGSVHAQIGNYEKGLNALYRALRIHEYLEDESSTNFTLNSIGVVLKAAKRYDEALEVYERVLKTDSLNTDVIMNIGSLYADREELKKAEVLYLKALKIDRENGNERFIASDLENLGNIYNKMELYADALSHHQEALKLREKLPYKVEEALSLSQVGHTHTLLKNHSLAKDFLNRALAVAEETKTTKLTRDIYQKLSELYSRKNDQGNAYKYLKSYTVLKDSLLNEESIRQVGELSAKYETEKKDQQIVILAKEKELQEKEIQRQATLKNASIIGAILIALLGGSFFYTFRLRAKNQKALDSKNREIREVNFQRQLTELEMKALQAQINPHFIFNCMNSINEMILDGNNDNASKYLTKFSKLIRLILENAEATEVSLENELTMLEAYIQLEALRFKGDIKYDIQVEDNIDLENTYLPSMVLQPFVENAIWHGLLHKKDGGKGKIGISIAQPQNLLVCQIEDNGVGREKALALRQKSVWKSKSLGVKITEERLNILSKEFKKQLIKIIDLKDKAGQALGTRVEVNIPIS